MPNGTPREHVDWEAKWAELHEAIGAAISAWSTLEHALAKAFAIVLGMPLNRIQPMFFAMHTFSAKRDLLWEAIQSNPLSPGVAAIRQDIFRAACKKAELYAPTRNKLAHSRPAIAAHGSVVLGGIVAPNVLHRDVETTISRVLTVAAISESRDSFTTLARLISRACDEPDHQSLEVLEQVRNLASTPYSDSLGLQVASKPALPPER
jgi:hypothetical protein